MIRKLRILLPLLILGFLWHPPFQVWSANPEDPPDEYYLLESLAPDPSVDSSVINNEPFVIDPTGGGANCIYNFSWPLPASNPEVTPGGLQLVKFIGIHPNGVRDTSFTPTPLSNAGTFNWGAFPEGTPLQITVPPATSKPNASIAAYVKWTKYTISGGEQISTPVNKSQGRTIQLGDYQHLMGDCIPNTDPGAGGDLPQTAIGGLISSNDSLYGMGYSQYYPLGPDGGCGGPLHKDQGEVYVSGEKSWTYGAAPGRGNVVRESLTILKTSLEPLGNNSVDIPMSAIILTINDPADRRLRGNLEITSLSGNGIHEVQLLGENPISTVGGTLRYALPTMDHAGCAIHYHGKAYKLRVRRVNTGPQELELRVIPLTDQGVPIPTDGGPVRIAKIRLEAEPPDLQEGDSASYTYSETGGTKYRKIALNGTPFAEGKPQETAESDIEEENGSVDALNFNLAYNTTDVHVPLVGDSLALAVRRQYVQEIWGTQPSPGSPNAFSPFSSMERPFGAAWRSGIGANIRIHVPKKEGTPTNPITGPTLVYVTDEQGSTHRFAQTWNSGGIAFIPLPSQTTDQDAFLMTLEIASGSGFSNWSLVFKRKFGTTLYFKPVVFPTPLSYAATGNSPFLQSCLGGSNLITLTANPGSSIESLDYYFRLRGRDEGGPAVTDSNGNELYYDFDNPAASLSPFIPSSISSEPSPNPARRMEIVLEAVSNANINTKYIKYIKLYSPENGGAPETWTYNYSTDEELGQGFPSPGLQLLVRLNSVTAPDGKIERGYTYTTKFERDLTPQESGKSNYYHNFMLSGLVDGGGYQHAIEYAADTARSVYLIKPQITPAWYFLQGIPWIVKEVYLRAPVNQTTPFTTDGEYTGAASSYVWHSSFRAPVVVDPRQSPVKIVRKASGPTVDGDRVNIVSDASGMTRKWTFSLGEVFGSEPFMNRLCPSSESIKNSVAQICWTSMEIEQGTLSNGVYGFKELYEFDPACGMALKKAVDISGAETIWEYKDVFNASHFIPALADSYMENGVSKPLYKHSFFPQFYSDPTKQIRKLQNPLIPGPLVDLIKTYTYWSSSSTDPLDHKKAWSRAMTSSTNENGVQTIFALDPAKGWLLTETVKNLTNQVIKKTDYAYGTPLGQTSKAFIKQITIDDGTGAEGAPDLITTRTCDETYWNLTSETTGSGTEKNVTYYQYDSFKRLRKTADGRAPAENPFGSAFATIMDYTPSGRLKTTSWTAGAGNYFPNPNDSTTVAKEISYDSRGRIAWEIDERGTKTHFSYTYILERYTIGDLSLEQRYSVSTWKDLGGAPNVRDGNDPLETRNYDTVGKLKKSISSSGLVTEYWYNALGSLVMVITTDSAHGDSPEYTKTVYEYVDTDNYLGGSLFDSSAVKPSKIVGPFRFGADVHFSGASTAMIYDSVGRKVQESVTYNSTQAAAVTSYTYDGVGNLRTAVDSLQYETETEYDALNRPFRVTREDGSYTQTTYSPAGLVLTTTQHVVSPTGTHNRQSAVSYDRAGRKAYDYPPDLLSGSASTSWVASYAYFNNGLLEKIERKRSATNPAVDLTSYTYDDRGRVSTETLPIALNAMNNQLERGMITYFYDAKGNKTKVLDPRGNESRNLYDRADRPVRSLSAPVVVYGQGTKRLVSETDYNAAGTPTKIKSGHFLDVGIDPAAAFNTASLAACSTVDNLYSQRGLLLETKTQPVTGDYLITKFGYDSVGNKIKVTDPLNNVTAFTYDAMGRVLETRHHENLNAGNIKEIVSNTYNHAVLLNSVEKMRGTGNNSRTKTFAYNNLYQLQGITHTAAGSGVASASYNELRATNSLGELLSVTSSGAPARSVVYVYDKRGRVVNETSLGRTHVYTYDDSGNRLTATYGGPVATVVTSVYDGLNRLDYMVEDSDPLVPGDRTTDYQYDFVGNIVRKVLPNGITEEKTFDPANRVTELKRTRIGLIPALDLVAYEYNSHASVAFINESYPATTLESGNNAVPRTVLNAYDRTQRLTSEAITVAGTTTATAFSYDNGDNRKTRTVHIGGASSVDETYYIGEGQEDFDNDGTLESRIYGANQLRKKTVAGGGKVIYVYDDFGNRSLKREYVDSKEGVETRYYWDQNNRLIKVERQDLETDTGGTAVVWVYSGQTTTWEFDYDYRGRRVIRNGPAINDAEIFIYSGGTSIHQVAVADAAVADWRTSPATQTALVANSVTYVRGSDMGGGVGGILYSLNNGTPTYQQHNTRGDVTGYTNSVGNFSFQSVFESFGKHTDYGTAPPKLTQRASSKEEEATLSLLNEGFRYRDIETGGFLSRDPAGFVDGPNLYAYVQQNPWSAFDPSGLQSMSAGLGEHLASLPPEEAKELSKAIVDVSGKVLMTAPVALAPAVAAVPEAIMAYTLARARIATMAVLVAQETGVIDLPVSVPKSKTKSESGCFPGGTLVRTVAGAAAIESIRPSDRLWTSSLNNGEPVVCEVTRVFVHEYTGEFVTITLTGGEKVTSTGNHPFRVLAGEALEARPIAEDAGPDALKIHLSGARWVAATDLHLGDLTWTTSGPQVITKIIRQFQSATVYNLGVAFQHTYLVGESGVLVHNKTTGEEGFGGGTPASSSKKIATEAEDTVIKGSGGPGKVYEIPGEQLTTKQPYIGKTKQATVADRMKDKDHRAKTPTGQPPEAKTLADELTEDETAGVEALLIQQRGLDNLSNKIPGLNPTLPKNQTKLDAGKKVLGQE